MNEFYIKIIPTITNELKVSSLNDLNALHNLYIDVCELIGTYKVLPNNYAEKISERCGRTVEKEDKSIITAYLDITESYNLCKEMNNRRHNIYLDNGMILRIEKANGSVYIY